MEEGEIEQSDAEFTPESLNDSGISDFCTKSEDNTGQDVSFDEVWDDSELINQWNFTVENFRVSQSYQYVYLKFYLFHSKEKLQI